MDTSESNQTITTVHTDLVSPMTCGGTAYRIRPPSESPHINSIKVSSRQKYPVVIDEVNSSSKDCFPKVPSEPHSHHHNHQHSTTIADMDDSVSLAEESCFRLTSPDGRKEPICIVLFKWFLIVTGSIMLCIVVFIMGDVLIAWIGAETRREQTYTITDSSEPNLPSNYSFNNNVTNYSRISSFVNSTAKPSTISLDNAPDL
ncbi:unnamed protein product [Lepeophtheirus salmonis]|uniref:(salmon louse) hypothetical protein n=1 Tax=Lepeophtheirus salmonis TaxID=72036 RepID=A0A7R8CVD1_LEPSM|nr:unnamed protein product [Lepeophtheirus salmonis]CAF2943921.1 unnamed protein product [Lepeophtheirus salmonis]